MIFSGQRDPPATAQQPAFPPYIPIFDPASIRARLARRSYWVLLMTDGRIIPEWTCDWPLAPLKGRRALRLYCPDGKVATLDDGKDCSGRLLQLKVAVRSAGGPAGMSGVIAHLIGLIWGYNGECSCAAWLYREKKLIQFTDNAHAMTFENIGAVCTDHVGLAAP